VRDILDFKWDIRVDDDVRRGGIEKKKRQREALQVVLGFWCCRLFYFYTQGTRSSGVNNRFQFVTTDVVAATAKGRRWKRKRQSERETQVYNSENIGLIYHLIDRDLFLSQQPYSHHAYVSSEL
jgi:hypothetical protein